MHVILDHLNTRKPLQDRWLALHAHMNFYFIPTDSSWLNWVEIWFSTLSRHPLRKLSSTAIRRLAPGDRPFLKAYQETAARFEWTQAVVHPSLKQRYSHLCKYVLGTWG